MSDSPLNETNLIATLEQSLRQTRNAQHRLLVRLREVESESERLRQEIEALDNSAEQTEAAIHSLLATIRSGNQPRLGIKNLSIDEDYEIPAEVDRMTRSNNHLQKDLRAREPVYREPTRKENRLPFAETGRTVPPVSQNIEPISQRFVDRTITQACTLLLRESGKALHVNELYNFLVAGGFEFKGNNPTISIAVSLNRNRRFRKVAPGTFDLVMRDASQAAS
ncbi:MAG: hypothetical protein HKN33_12420 [Pyrinomonadaceae bacterium]|nr:hypothetical protein [Pyrinomonadaceae bacterium]